MRQHRRGADIAKARVEHVRAVRRGLEPRRHDVARGDLSPCSGEEVLSEVRVAVAGRPNCCGDCRPARRMRELATGGDTLPLHRSCALQRRAPDEPPAPILGARPVQHAGHRAGLHGRRRSRVGCRTAGALGSQVRAPRAARRRRRDRPRGRPAPTRRRTLSRRDGPGLPHAQRSRFAPCSSNASDPSPGRVT